jgi:phenylacetate-CoA ligase
MTKGCSSLWKKRRIVITSLFNKAHPFIRYDIGDIGALDEKALYKDPFCSN